MTIKTKPKIIENPEFLEKIKELKSQNRLSYLNLKSLSKVLNEKESSLVRHRKWLIKQGFIIETLKRIEQPEFIEKFKEFLEKPKRHFTSMIELSKELGESISILRNNLDFFTSHEFTFGSIFESKEFQRRFSEILDSQKEFENMRQLADMLDVKEHVINQNKEWFIERGAIFKEKKIILRADFLSQLERLKNENRLMFDGWPSFIKAIELKDLSPHHFIDSEATKNFIKEHGFTVGRFKLIELKWFLDLLRNLKNKNLTTFSSLEDFACFIDVNVGYLRPYRQFFVEKGFEFIRGNFIFKGQEASRMIKEKIEKLSKKTFNSKNDLANLIGVPIYEISRHIDIVLDSGIIFNDYKYHKKEEEIAGEIKKAIEENIFENKISKLKSSSFLSKEELAKALDCTSAHLKRHWELIKKNNISIMASAILEILNFTNDLKRKGESLIFFSLREFALSVNPSMVSSIYKHKDFIESQGVTFDDNIKRLINQEEIQTKLKGFSDNEQNVFQSIKELSELLGVESASLGIYKEYLLEKGFLFLTDFIGNKKASPDQFKRLKKHVLVKIKTLKDKGIDIIENDKEAARLLEIPFPLFNRKMKGLLENSGIAISITKHTAKTLNQNYDFLLKKLKEEEIKLSSIDAFVEAGTDFYNIKVNTSKSQLEPLFMASGVYQSFTEKERMNQVSRAYMDILMDYDTDIATLKEIKFYLLCSGIYLSTEDIENAIEASGEALSKETIVTRLRLAKKIVESGYIKIDYKKNLPDINNSEDSKVVILESIKNNFHEHWGQFVLYAAKNDLLASTVSREIIKVEKGESLISLIAKYPQIGKAYLLLGNDEVRDFESMTYDSILALCVYCGNYFRNTEERFRSIRNFIYLFFNWLVKNNKALFHGSLFNFMGNQYLSNGLEKLFKKHIITKAHIEAGESEEVSLVVRNRFFNNKNNINRYCLTSSMKPNANLKDLAAADIRPYIETAGYITPSGEIKQETYLKELLLASGNKNNLKKNKLLTVREHFYTRIRMDQLSSRVLRDYNDLIESMIRIIEHDSRENSRSTEFIRTHTMSISFLLEFLEEFSNKVSAEELKTYFNPIERDNLSKPNMLRWAISKDKEKKYRAHTTHYHTLFSNLGVDNEYYGIFNINWKQRMKKVSQERTLIRPGLEYAVYITNQNVALHNPPKTPDIPTIGTAPSGEILDLSWWPHRDTNIVLAMCNWLVSKLPRRAGHIRNLDVNTFLRYNPDGTLRGFYFNTDKNQSSSANNREIPYRLLATFFTESEFKLIEKYVQYIKDAFGYYERVEYLNGGHYEKIQPLFPSHNSNNIIQSNLLNGYHTKTLLKALLTAKEHARKGDFNELYTDEIRESKIKHILELELIVKDNKKNVNLEYGLPTTVEEIESINFSTYNWFNRFKSLFGMHNMRHAGATALLTNEGIDLYNLKTITGHTSLDVLTDVYLHNGDKDIIEIGVTKISSLLASFMTEPAKAGAKFIEKELLPLVETSNSSGLYQKLTDNGFMSLPRRVSNRTVEIYGLKEEQKNYSGNYDIVDDGVKIASRFHPANYDPQGYGICTIGQRCPAESNSICCLCPHLIFNAVHIEPVLHKRRQALMNLEFIKQEIKKAHKNGVTSTRAELKLKHSKKLEEFLGWDEMIIMIKNQLESKIQEPGKKSQLTAIKNDNMQILSAKIVTENELLMETICSAKKLHVNDPNITGMIARITNVVIAKALKKRDWETIDRFEEESIDWLIDAYSSQDTHGKQGLLVQYIEKNNPSDKGQLEVQTNIDEAVTISIGN